MRTIISLSILRTFFLHFLRVFLVKLLNVQFPFFYTRKFLVYRKMILKCSKGLKEEMNTNLCYLSKMHPRGNQNGLALKNKIKKKKREKNAHSQLPSAESPIMINITISLPIHVTFKKACQKREETRANIQCDNFNFLCDNAHYISKDLQFTAYKKQMTEAPRI